MHTQYARAEIKPLRRHKSKFGEYVWGLEVKDRWGRVLYEDNCTDLQNLQNLAAEAVKAFDFVLFTGHGLKTWSEVLYDD